MKKKREGTIRDDKESWKRKEEEGRGRSGKEKVQKL